MPIGGGDEVGVSLKRLASVASALLTAASVAILTMVFMTIAGVPPFEYLGDRVWQSPVQGVFGTVVAVLAIVGGVVVVRRLYTGRGGLLQTIALSVALSVLSAGGSLALLQSTVTMYLPIVDESDGR